MGTEICLNSRVTEVIARGITLGDELAAKNVL